MKTAVFVNFSPEVFIGFWNGKSYGPSIVKDTDGKNKKGFKPGDTMAMPDYLAKHFAKHLANRELLRKAKDHPEFERFTSPKKPEEVPEFMALFNQACIMDESIDDEKKDELDVQMEVIAKNRAQKTELPANEEEVHVVTDFPEDEEDETAEKEEKTDEDAT